MKTETVMEPPASDLQLAYIKRLQVELGEPETTFQEGLSRAEASRLIENLLGKNARNGLSTAKTKINEPRLGMAMKECFRICVPNCADIWEGRRAQFTDRVIETHKLFTEIAERLEADLQRQPSATTEHAARQSTGWAGVTASVLLVSGRPRQRKR